VPVSGRVSVGFFSFTEVPATAHHSYNEWHQYDHLPEQYQLPGVMHGERWVASPDCVAARVVDDLALLGRAQYMTLYLMGEPLEPTIDAFGALGRSLREAGRFHEERTALMAGAWRVAAAETSPRLPISPSVIPWRPASGVFVLVESLDDAPPSLAPLLAVPGVAGGWTFEPDPGLTRSWWLPQPYRITVLWLDADPVAVAAALAPVVRARPTAPVLAAPYRTVVPGNWSWFD
jgi:hypothetical protein